MLRVRKYTDEDEQTWDAFVNKSSVNGTFLQTRNFLNYHQEGKFNDHSLIIYSEKSVNDIHAVVPACVIDDGTISLVSHPGSTFGGFIIHRDRYQVQAVIDIVGVFKQYVTEYEFKSVILKITSDLFSAQKSDLLQYALFHSGYSQYVELSAYIDLAAYENEISANYNSLKRRQLKKSMNFNLAFRQLTNNDEISEFYDLLSTNLLKFDTKPVHTLEELYDFVYHRLIDIVRFYGVYYENNLVAGCMCFIFDQTKTIHTQYLCSQQAGLDFVPMPFMYQELVKHVRELGFRFLSLGISTENKGVNLNMGLAQSKESIGCSFTLNRTFFVNLL